MKRLLTLLALVLCSCAETFVGEEVARPNNENLPDLTATFADEDATRTYVENNKYLRWHEDDRLTAFYGNTLNRQYKFNGATGDNSGTFSLVPSGELGTGNTLDAIYAIYPYDENASITDDGVITLTLPTEQTYAENSFGRGVNTMLAVTENLEDTFLAFKNACGYLKLKLYNADGTTIKSIEVKGNNGERLAGAATATIAFGEAPVLAMADDATTSVTLNCGEGVALGTTAETATEFWIVLPATTFAEGLTITATDTEGGVFEKSTTNEVIIERNAIQPMAALEAEFNEPTQPNNEIWYTNGSTTKATTPYKTNAFGANIVSNTYDAKKECWVIMFDGDVTTIGERTFYNCSNLTTITIPDNVTTIGYGAFYNCESLTNVIIPDSVTTIGNSAFYNCESLTSVTIPDSLTSIGYSAFHGCSSLTELNGNFVSDDGRCIIVDGVLSCFLPTGLTEYTIPDSVTSIGVGAFYYCNSLTSVTIPDSVTSIGDSTFSNCSSLISVKIGKSVTSIGYSAFAYCSSLTSITIPDSVTTIGNSAFYDCESLTNITIPNGVTMIGNYAFCECDSLTSVTIPDSVTTIGNYAFYVCRGLTSVTIPDSVTTIGEYAFSCCRSLTSITIPDSVTAIRFCAFSCCSSLTIVKIGNSVTSIGASAFDDCSSLTSVYCKATTPPWMEYGVFENNDEWDPSTPIGCKIYVPMGSVEAYKSASGWSWYESYIRGYDFDNSNYTITLNNAWRQSTSVSNPDSSLYDGVYESYSNYNVNDGVATMYIDIEGYTEFSIYVRSNAESSYDYVTVSELDSTTSKMTTSGIQNSGTALSSYTKVTYSGIDEGSHRITVTYKKDYSQHSGTDRGYLIIPKNQ